MNYVGKGIYTLSEASKITHVNRNSVRRWLAGYSYKRRDSIIDIPPIFHRDFEGDSNQIVLSFLDLIEIVFIKSFISLGVSIYTIKKAAIEASRLLQNDHPFAMQKFYTDGKTILARIAKAENDSELIDLLKKQYQFEPIVLPSLYECLDFNDYHFASKWWPLGKNRDIVIDPKRNFGKPSLVKSNISTGLIYDLYKSGHEIPEISEWYELGAEQIKKAIEYEKSTAA